MKQYVKPDFKVIKFWANQNVASCDATEYYNPVTVNCYASGYEVLWASTNTDCGAEPSSSSVITYNGTQYFVWYSTDHTGGLGGTTDFDLLRNILLTAGYTETQIQSGVYHAAPYSTDISSNYQMSH